MLNTYLLGFIIFLLFVILFFVLPKTPKKRFGEGRKLTKEKRIWIIAEAITRYIKRNEANNALYKAFNITSPDNVFIDVRIFLTRYAIPRGLTLFQDLFDQILKMYAEDMQKIFNREDQLKENYGEDEVFWNSMSRHDLEKKMEEKRDLERDKERVENEFWTLYDALKCFGIKTFGDGRNYKPYLVLTSAQQKVYLPNPQSFKPNIMKEKV
mgnify:FL=1